MKKLNFVLVILVSMFMLASCGIPKESKEKALALESSIKAADSIVNLDVAEYNQLKASKEFADFKVYADREVWENWFKEANSELARAVGVRVDKIAALLEENDRDKEQELLQQVNRVNGILKEAKMLSRKPLQRYDYLVKVRKEAPNMIKTAKGQNESAKKIVNEMKSPSTKAEGLYLGKQTRPKQYQTQLAGLSADANKAFTIANTEFEKKAPDYAVFSKQCGVVKSKLADTREHQKLMKKKFKEVSSSYSKILEDMKEDYYVVVGRTSWNNSSDWNTDEDHLYKERNISEAHFDYFDGWNENNDLASEGWGLSVKMDENIWKSLKLDPKESWPSSSHGSASYWLNDYYAKYYQKFTYVKNGKKAKGNWEKVTEEAYEENWDDLGMEILAKPYGYYESEALKEASPPGMSYVGNPEYGRWETGANGERHWSFLETYAFYHLMFGGNHYYGYNSWNSWNNDYRGRQSYYGSTTRTVNGKSTTSSRYGSAGSKTSSSSKYKSSTFSRSGGMKSAKASAKSGGGNRGGGPGGGGK